MPVPVIWQNFLSVWQNCLYIEEHASDLEELPVPLIRKNHLYVDSVPVIIWQNCLYSVPVIWQNACASDLAELSVCGQCASDLAELSVCLAELPVY